MAADGERLAKYLSRAGIASRREAERLIAAGLVTLDGQTITTPATLVRSGQQVRVKSVIVSPQETIRLWRYHKPRGVLTTRVDGRGRPTLVQRLPAGMEKSITVGRLDMNSEGLLLLTNHGGLARFLEHPAQAIPRSYRVRVHGQVTEAHSALLAEGLLVDGVRYQPITTQIDGYKGTHTWVTLTLTEGKNREIRRVMQYLGLVVTRLIRIGYGGFRLGILPRDALEEVPSRSLTQALKKLGWPPCAS